MEFESLSFRTQEDGIRVSLYNIFYFDIPKSDLRRLGDYELSRTSIGFKNPKGEKRFDFLIAKHIRKLKNMVSGNDSVYVHQDSGIPLMGLNFLGIVDKGSEMIEIKPLTSCNMNCTFCSVDEGPDSKKQVDFVVEEEYLVQELFRLLEHKDYDMFQIWINPHGEPTFYAPIVKLVRDIAAHPKVKDVILITNATLLNPKLISELREAGLARFSVSMSGISKGKEMLGMKTYDVDRVMDMAKKAHEAGIGVTITPVYVKGHNDDEMKDIIGFCRRTGCDLGIQKFCYNRFGRNPIKEQGWDEFFEDMRKLEKETGYKILGELGRIQETGELERPFRKGDVVEAEVVCTGRWKKDRVAVAKDRAILVPNCTRRGQIKVKITQDKHNMFIGTA